MSTTDESSSQSKFVESAFKTSVSEDEIDDVLRTLDTIVSDLRNRFDTDDLLEAVLRRESGKNGIKGDFSTDNQDPEPLTQQAAIEPLMTALGHDNWTTEVSGASEDRSRIADYSIPLDEYSSIDSKQLLIEAEPINKPLDTRGHGISQVEDWLGQREFESDFGFATDGLRWVFIRYDPDTYNHDRIKTIDLSEICLTLFLNQTGAHDDPVTVVDAAGRETVEEFLRTFQHDNFVSIATDAREVIKQTQESITDDFYETYIQVVFGVRQGGDVRSDRSLVGEGVEAPEAATGDDTRLFAVKTMNRLIFVKFLEDKGIVQSDLLADLKETYEDGAHPRSLYKTFVETLFFDVMNKRPEDRSEYVDNLSQFEDIPYLNGGLFRPVLSEDHDINEREFDITNSVLTSIIELLEKYAFSADGGPYDLDPSVLGNVFEKTINYLTGDPGDKNKELGAYYTPSEITRFSAERTVRPALYDRFKPIVQEELGWPDETFDRYDTIYSLIEALPADMAVLGPLLEELDELRVVDPAMGSGHFLTSVLEEIVSVRKAIYAQNDAYPNEYRLKKTTVQNNIYGVDIVGPAVEIGKLRLWLSVIAEVTEEDAEELDIGELALPNIAFNLRQGNSLIGYTGFPEEADEEDSYTLGKYSKQSVRDRYNNIIEQIEKYEDAEGFPEKAEEHREKAIEYLENAREELVPKLQHDFNNAGVESITRTKIRELDPFNWVLEFAEVYSDGGFDVLVGNPPWERIKPLRDDFFTRYDAEFRTLMPEAKDSRQEELLGEKSIEENWEEYQQDIEILSTYFSNSEGYTLQSPVVDGRSRGTENDLSALFLERVFQITRDDGYVAQVLPGAIWNGLSTKDLRMHLLDETSINALVSFENKGIFDAIDDRYNFGVVTFENQGQTNLLHGTFQQRDLEILQEFEKKALEIPRRVLADYSPVARIFPYVKRQEEVDVLNQILKHPPINDDSQEWHGTPYRELDRTNDSDRFVETESDGDYPVLGGSNIFQFTHDSKFHGVEPPEFWSVDQPEGQSGKHRIREKKVRSLKGAIYDAFDGTGSKKGFVNELLTENRGKQLTEDDVQLDCSEYRIVYRDIARSSDERTSIASVIPPGVVCHNTLHTIEPYTIEPEQSDLANEPLHSMYERIFSDEELFACLGLLNSIPFDFLMRTKTDTHIVMYKFKESQVPRLTKGDEWFDYISERAAKLNCYGDDFQDMRERLGDITPATTEEERRTLQAELDAAAFHAYGLGREQTKFVLDDFHQVQNPRLMDDDYFETVLEKYDSLA